MLTNMAPKSDLTELERDLYEYINSGAIDKVKDVLSQKGVRVDCYDDHGMTPLQHAAFKGSKELCELLLAHGADPNSSEHENGYTTLMFAALAGSEECVTLMLEAGAKTNSVNSVGRTATQMAAFVGQHACVSIINNFFSRDEVDYYTKIQGFEKEPKLEPHLSAPLHRLIMFSNLNPVRIALHVEKNKDLLESASRVARVLDLICEKQFKQRDVNEVLSMKMHYLACVLRACHKWNVEKPEGLTAFIRSLLKGREPDGFQLGIEKIVRDSIREYPYHEAQLLQQMVRNIAPVTPGEEPSALCILTQGINGSQSFTYENVCSACGEKNAEKKCSACKSVNYCDQNCQKLHWFTHKKVCKHFAEQYQKQKKLDEEMKQMELQEKEKQEKENGNVGPEGDSATKETDAEPSNKTAEDRKDETETKDDDKEVTEEKETASQWDSNFKHEDTNTATEQNQ
ncbi:ankyrin repeat and MYND domain-containing protein 2-like [Ptychodera flava]|uniref:ankyrin repeat and MYND domain-containing protein 2-like n=1 Tax=Ptychodera flava TaxID=63121 RepID=UPI00396A1ED3